MNSYCKLLSTLLLLFIAVETRAQCEQTLALSPACAATVIAHRGYSHIYPENTLLSIEEAFKHGVKYCEVDISLTADSVYVLFHDVSALHRTTNGTGTIDGISYENLKKLDAGSWKAAYFKGMSIPTLAEALKVAEAYDAYLYLDTKDYNLKALKQALDLSGARPDRFLPSLEGIGQAKSFRAVFPNTPWVWYYGGALPDDVDNPAFYANCVNLGCRAFEISCFEVDTSSNWINFREQVHQVKAAIWAFVVNNNELAASLQKQGVDAFETDRSVSLARFLCSASGNNYPDSLTTGNWRFIDGLNNSKGLGSQLRPRAYKKTTNTHPLFRSQKEWNISSLGDSSQSVMLVPPQPSDEGLLVYTGFSVDDNGPEDLSYSLVMDFLIPDSSFGKWIALYQTNVKNTDDADLFINPSGQIGSVGYYFGSLKSNTWYRVAITYDVQIQELKIYIDGLFLGSVPTYGNRWSILNSSPSGEDQGFLLFADNDDETAAVMVSSFQVRDYPLNDSDIQLLGKANISEIPNGNTELILPKAPQSIDKYTLLDYDKQIYHMLFPAGTDLSTIPLTFNIPQGAQCDHTAGMPINLAQGPVTITVRSADGSKQSSWKICAKLQSETAIYAKENSALTVYPNPSSDFIHIKADQAFNHLRLMDLQGRILREEHYQFGSKFIALDLSNEIAGNYLLEVYHTEESSRYRGLVSIQH